MAEKPITIDMVIQTLEDGVAEVGKPDPGNPVDPRVLLGFQQGLKHAIVLLKLWRNAGGTP